MLMWLTLDSQSKGSSMSCMPAIMPQTHHVHEEMVCHQRKQTSNKLPVMDFQ
jgi:hypothetical protein